MHTVYHGTHENFAVRLPYGAQLVFVVICDACYGAVF